jgi:DNA-binding beta-propeller fold protein YncE
VAVDADGFIVVADSGNNRVQVFDATGRYHSSFGTWGTGDGQMKGVEAVAVTADGRVIVSDRENHRVQIF